ncbi:MAG: arginine--tRNA ligase [Lachnospiraceae bacterium]|nr:arginine--tRNA ligase [Lachnospiraceae bacterium]
MKRFIDLLTDEVSAAFEACGFEARFGRVVLSNRPDLCEFQCSGAMAAAKTYKTAPVKIAQPVADVLAKKTDVFAEVAVVMPGFINLKVSPGFLSDYAGEMTSDARMGYETLADAGNVVVDYGGANVAKPLHVGHLRSAVIGESVKRILSYAGYNAVGDVHLGDWGLPIGQIIAELHFRKPDLVYFDEDYEGEYPEEAPFTISELEEIYPCASGKCKTDEAFKEAARQATMELQSHRRGYMALWHHIMSVSVADLKKNYDNLNVHFEVWGKESDAENYIPAMIERLKADGFAEESDGALVVHVKEETDTKEIPPCMLLKSNGATVYDTTDLATIVERMEKYDPRQIVYVVDKRQELHFEQVFRAARKSGITGEANRLRFIGFGTMNGKDGKPFKTREGGVMRLENLIGEINDAVMKKMTENRTMSEEETAETAKIVGLAALKYGDLSNQASKDYVFDVDRFTSFEGNTGPYILYTIVRIKSILAKYEEMTADRGEQEKNVPASETGSVSGVTGRAESSACAGNKESSEQDGCEPIRGMRKICCTGEPSEKALLRELVKYNDVMEGVRDDLAPHRICSYIYDVSDAFSAFYRDVHILSEEDAAKRESYIAMLRLTKKILEQCIWLLGFDAPEHM